MHGALGATVGAASALDGARTDSSRAAPPSARRREATRDLQMGADEGRCATYRATDETTDITLVIGGSGLTFESVLDLTPDGDRDPHEDAVRRGGVGVLLVDLQGPAPDLRMQHGDLAPVHGERAARTGRAADELHGAPHDPLVEVVRPH